MREGLLDYLIPTQPKGMIVSEKIRRWKNLGGIRVKLLADLQPRTQPGDAYVALAKRYYDAGADGLYLWDGDRRPPRASEWAVVRRLGHRELLDRLAHDFASYWRRVPLNTLNGLAVNDSFSDG